MPLSFWVEREHLAAQPGVALTNCRRTSLNAQRSQNDRISSVPRQMSTAPFHRFVRLASQFASPHSAVCKRYLLAIAGTAKLVVCTGECTGDLLLKMYRHVISFGDPLIRRNGYCGMPGWAWHWQTCNMGKSCLSPLLPPSTPMPMFHAATRVYVLCECVRCYRNFCSYPSAE